VPYSCTSYEGRSKSPRDPTDLDTLLLVELERAVSAPA
jgi:hypothetical protein